MTGVDTPQTHCRAGFARADITPPVGMYHRMWGAATHDRSTGVHRPLLATALWLESVDGTAPHVVIGVDHCLLDTAEFARIRERVCRDVPLTPVQVQIALSHTHGSGWMSRSRSDLPGGELLGPYLDQLAERCAAVAAEAMAAAQPASIVYGNARCSLAAHRDFWDADCRQFVCGFNPAGPADDTVLVAKVTADDGRTLGTVVNYACHPTTLAYQNTLISPDYIGTMRDVVEGHTAARCLFLQGASGDLGPREGFVGDPSVADRNGRQLGFAALSGLEALPPPGMRFEYAGPVVSGATLGTWEHGRQAAGELARHAAWDCQRITVELPYRVDLPTREATRAERSRWRNEEDAARAAGDAGRARDCRAHVERMTRQLARLESLPEGKTFPFPVTLLRLGGAVWVFAPGELYHWFQVTLRVRFPDRAIIVTTITGDWHPGYLPPATGYGYGIYQEAIAALAPGSLEILLETVSRELGRFRPAT